MLDNCFFFNKAGSFHHRYATRLRNLWSPWAERLMTRTLSHHGYCCGERRYLSGMSYRCRGGTCFIKYGSQYWYYPMENDEDLVFCQTHYQKLAAEVRGGCCATPTPTSTHRHAHRHANTHACDLCAMMNVSPSA